MERGLEVTGDVVVFELGCREEDGIDDHRDRRKAAPSVQSLTVEHYHNNTPIVAHSLREDLFANPRE